MLRSVAFFLSLALVILSAPVGADITPKSVSSSRQFVVFGGDIITRGAVCDAAERLKINLLRLLQTPDRWQIPILVYLQPAQANPPELPETALHFSQTGAGLKLQVDLLLSPKFETNRFAEEMTRAVLLETAYRTSPNIPAGEQYFLPPDWLIEGIIASGDEAAPAENMSILSLRRLLSQKIDLLDSPSTALFRVQSAALVRMLSGSAALSSYVSDLPRPESDPVARLQRFFPAFGPSPEEAERQWRVRLTQMAAGRDSGPQPFRSTGERLDQLLARNIASPTKAKVTLPAACHDSHLLVDRRAAAALAQDLMLASSQAHPLLRPIVIEFGTAAEELAKGHRRGLGKRAEKADSARREITTRMNEADDYLNWFEATQAGAASDDFRGYLRAAETESVPRRHDPLSIYLDAMAEQIQ